jgi:hypothetical protein
VIKLLSKLKKLILLKHFLIGGFRDVFASKRSLFEKENTGE